jgi:hypothetical protein
MAHSSGHKMHYSPKPATFYEYYCIIEILKHRVGGGLAPADLSHHRTYGSVYGGS